MMNLWIRWQNARHALVRRLRDERGASDMVTIIIIVGIVVAVALIFRDRLTETIGKIFNRIDTEVIQG